jgi:hypothetical protein
MATWATLIALLSIHLATNYAAVKAVSMHCLNRQRANIVFSNILQHGEVLSPHQVSKHERVFERDGVLRWSDGQVVGYCKIGIELRTLLSHIGFRDKQTGSVDMRGVDMSELLDVFADEAYILWPATVSHEAVIVLKEGCTPIDQLKAWAHALLLARRQRGRYPGSKPGDDDTSPSKDRLVAELRRALEDIRGTFEEHVGALQDNGWDLDVAVLETRAGTRARVATHKA